MTFDRPFEGLQLKASDIFYRDLELESVCLSHSFLRQIDFKLWDSFESLRRLFVPRQRCVFDCT